jgi:toxin YhaV
VAQQLKTPNPAVLRVNGWTIMLHPLFLDQIAATVAQIERARAKDAAGYKSKNCSKRLAAVLKLAFEAIPQDPAADAYRQGRTLGGDYTHWRRAKFFQQYRLFFRYDKASRVIIYAWCNDETTKRAYGSNTDAYTVFSAMLAKARPPDDWADLKQECDAEEARRKAAAASSVMDEIGKIAGV